MKVLGKIISSMEKILLNREPCFETYDGSVFRNEKKCFQLAYMLQEEESYMFNKVRVKSEISDRVKLNNIQFVPAIVIPSYNYDEYFISKSVGLYPDVIKPFDNIGLVLVKLQWRAVWVEVDTIGLKAGKYDITFILEDENGNSSNIMKYVLEVLDAELEPSDLIITCWMHYDCISEKHNIELFSDQFYRIFKNYLKVYVDIGHTMLLTPIFTPPLDTKVGAERRTAQLIDIEVVKGEYKFHFEKLEKFLKFVLENGIKYIEFSHLFTQWGAECCPKIMATVDGEYKRIFGWEISSEDTRYICFLKELLPRLVKVIEKMGICKKCFFHLSDEPNKASIEKYARIRTIVKNLIGDIKTIDALSEYEFYERGLVDIAVPVTNAFYKFVDKGIKTLMVYYCGPAHGYFSNRIMNMPLQRTRILGMQLYETGVQGFLHWGFNFYNSFYSVEEIDPYTTTDAGGKFFSGDSFLVYPYKNGVYMSERAYAMQEAFNDYRALKTLEKYVGRGKVLQLLHKYGIRGFEEYPRSAVIHNRIREEINHSIINYINRI